MKIFVFEFICGGGLAGQAAVSELMPLGGAMLRCIIEDMTSLGVDVVTTLDERVSLPLPAKTQIVRVGDATTFDAGFSTALLSADAALVIAPEFHGLLETLSKRVVVAGKRLIGCDPRGVAECSDKLKLATRLRRACIATPRTLAGIPTGDELAEMLPMVVKPRFGAGCEDTFVVHHESEIAELPARSDWIAQPLVPGTAASAAFIVKNDGSVMPLRAGLQKIARGGDETKPSGARRLAYSGGVMPVSPLIEARLLALGAGALAGVRGLRGFVGVDLLIGSQGGAAKDCVIEVNPRLTVAYVGLRALSQDNLAGQLLDAAGLTGPWSTGEPPRWRIGQIDFTGNGDATWSPPEEVQRPRLIAGNPA